MKEDPMGAARGSRRDTLTGRLRVGRGSPALCALLLAACSGPAGPEPLGQASRALDDSSAAAGRHFFNDALALTNGRACATCHPASDHFALTPQHVNELF